MWLVWRMDSVHGQQSLVPAGGHPTGLVMHLSSDHCMCSLVENLRVQETQGAFGNGVHKKGEEVTALAGQQL